MLKIYCSQALQNATAFMAFSGQSYYGQYFKFKSTCICLIITFSNIRLYCSLSLSLISSVYNDVDLITYLCICLSNFIKPYQIYLINAQFIINSGMVLVRMTGVCRTDFRFSAISKNLVKIYRTRM